METFPETPQQISKTELFYQELLEKALASIPESGAVMVIGPLFILRPTTENLSILQKAQQDLRKQGQEVFDQRPFLDISLPDAPFDYQVKFPLFFKKLIQSGKITACYLMDDWEKSEGTRTEVEYCKEAGIPIFKL